MTFKEQYELMKEQYYSKDRMDKLEALRLRLLGKQVVLFGAAWIGDFVYERLVKMGIVPICFADNFAVGCTPNGHSPILKPQKVLEMYPESIIILSLDRAKDIVYQQLLEMGFAREQIITDTKLLITTMDMDEFQKYEAGYEWAYDFFDDQISKNIVIQRMGCYLLGTEVDKSSYPQYFEKGLFEFSEKEVFVDGGFFTGDTAEEFVRQTNGKYQMIYGFEPDRFVREKVPSSLKNEHVQIIPKGLDEKEGTVYFATTGGHSQASGGNVVEGVDDAENVVQIPVTSIDRFFENKPADLQPTFIKMDIEGAEKAALKGAENTIRRYKPRLAICVYHKPEDIYELTRIIKEYNPQYQLTLRHYAHYFWETVLYAY